MKKKTKGIILLVIGLMAVLGCIAKGMFAEMSEGIKISDVSLLACMVTLIIAGLVMIIKAKSKKEEKFRLTKRRVFC